VQLGCCMEQKYLVLREVERFSQSTCVRWGRSPAADIDQAAVSVWRSAGRPSAKRRRAAASGQHRALILKDHTSRLKARMNPDALVAKVRDGRLVLDVETDLAEGTEVSLVRNPSARRDERRCDLLLFVTTEDERKALYNVAERMGLPTREISGR
jgi:hypothetical protein